MEINLEIDPKDATMLELNVLRSPNKEEYTRIVFMEARGVSQGRDYKFGEVARLQKDPAPGVTPSISSKPAVKESIITIESSYALAVRVYPSRHDATGISLRSQRQDSELKLLEAWQMKSI